MRPSASHRAMRLAVCVLLLLGWVGEEEALAFSAYRRIRYRSAGRTALFVAERSWDTPARTGGNFSSGFRASSPLPEDPMASSNWNSQANGASNGASSSNGYVIYPNSTTLSGASGKNGKVAPTAPEINQWTTVMTDTFEPSLKSSAFSDLEQWYKGNISSYDTEQVDRYWDRMCPTLSYLGTERVARIEVALRVAFRAHRGQMRKSGEPFIIHPVEVALLLSELKMDGETIMAGLLHDTVEDTALTFEEIEAMFGNVVRSIVEGETKVSKLPKLALSDCADEQAENLRQMFVAMTDDYRIIIVKLADRLHNMRTLRHMKPEKQIKISRETLDIFAPLAHRMGIWQFKSELEDTAFMYLYPQEYKRLNRRLRQHQSKFRETLDKSQSIMLQTLTADRTLKEQAAEVKVYGRTKELYSLWHKMEMKGDHNLDHILDVVALRVVITPKDADQLEQSDPNYSRRTNDRGVWLCYHVLGLVQHLPGFQPVPTRVKDYISFPKPNGYQSLHTALMLGGQAIEVQIRTSEMHQVAEYGMASHWAYTDSKRRQSRAQDDSLYNTPWLASIKEWQDDLINSRDFVDAVRRELLGKRVFVFLRNGKILNLAKGATAIDAAFQIHTEVGLQMHGVEINGRRESFAYELKNGDVVSILTGGGKPQTDWMRYAKSRSTRSKLRSYFRAKQKESLRDAGKILLMDYLWLHGPLIETKSRGLSNFSVPATVEDLASFLPGKTKYNDVEDLLVDVGKKYDRTFLHQTISKIFHVPHSLLSNAEKTKESPIPPSVSNQVWERRRVAKDAKVAADNAVNGAMVNGAAHANKAVVADASASPPVPPVEDKVLVNRNTFEYADPEHLCEACLPVHGDEVIGTRPKSADSATTVVHRLGCPRAQRAINQAKQTFAVSSPLQNRIDSITLKLMRNSRFGHGQDAFKDAVPVKLKWADLYEVNCNTCLYTAEVLVVAEDRKLLLADCSEIVSEQAEIVKTGSATTNEHAKLVFLVKVTGLDHLQRLMDQLSQVRSVMSVERRFGSELL